MVYSCYSTPYATFSSYGAYKKIDHVVDVRASRCLAQNLGVPNRSVLAKRTHLRNRFQIATATAANTQGTHNCIFAQTAQSLGRRWAKCTSSICWLCFVLRTKSVTKTEMNKCMAELYYPGGIRTRAARLISQYHNH